jgi:tetratricopeptide (TPR) repeat protein
MGTRDDVAVNEDKEAAERQFVEAYHLPEGMARHEALERAARAADALDHLPLAVSCRIALIRSAYDLGRYDLMLAPFAWCGTAEQRDPTAFDEWETHSFDWAHKWIVSGLIADHRFTLAQIGSFVDQLAARYQRLGYSMQPVHGARADLAAHVGDDEAYREHFARYLAMDRGPMSDCEACVIEEQAGHLIRQGRHAEAVAHAEHQLAQETGCATQPQGILTTLTPAFVALGELDRARQAHVVAYRLVRDDMVGGYLDDHLEFCATSGNVRRGVELLRGHLHRVHHSTSPSRAMHFAAGAALLLSRVSADEEFAVPRDGRTTVLSAPELRELLEAQALEIAGRFDQRNGTAAVSTRIKATLAAQDTIPVPLAVPVAAPPVPLVEEPIAVADPVELAQRMCDAFDQGEFILGMRLLRSLPEDMDPLLPESLGALVAARRATAGGHMRPKAEVVAELDAAIDRLAACGEHDLANRYRARSAALRAEEDGLAAASAVARTCLAEAEVAGTAYTRVLTRLLLADLLADAADSADADEAAYTEEHGALTAEALELAEAEAPELVTRARCDRAQHLASTGRLDEAHAEVADILASDPSTSVRFDALRLLLKVQTVRGDEDAVRTATEFVTSFSTPRGPWTAEAHRQRVASVERLGLEAEHLVELREAVTAGHEVGVPDDVAKACYALAGGYLKSGRYVEAAEALEEAVRVVESGDVDPDVVVPVRYRLGQVCARLDETETARRHLEAALGLVPADEPWRRAMVLDVLAGVLRRLDLRVEAASAYQGAAAAWQSVSEFAEAAGSLVEAAAALPNEEAAECATTLTEAEALVPSVEDPDHRTHLTARIAAIRAFLHVQAGEHAAAIEQNGIAEELAAQLEDADWQTFLVARGAKFLLDSGDPVNAEAEVRRAGALINDETPPQILGDIANVLDEALRAQSKPTTGDPLLRALATRLED